MNLSINLVTSIEVTKLSDLVNYGQFMRQTKMKVNKSRIARELKVDRRTVSKYLDGYEKPTSRVKTSKYEKYTDIITELLNSKTQIFYYRKVLYRYLKDEYGLKGTESGFMYYLKKHTEFESYFNEGKVSNKGTNPVIRYETEYGEQAQLDWKEDMPFTLKDGKEVKINILVLMLGYSRFRVYMLSMHKKREMLLDLLTKTFEILGGTPKTLLVDNMKTIMDIPRTQYKKGKINDEFAEYAKDFGMKVIPCKAGTPKTKGKVESQMRVLDEIQAYSGTLSYVELEELVRRKNNEWNMRINQGSGKIPIKEYEKEKGSLQPLPHENVRNQYKIKTIEVKVNTASMITVKGNQYSVPTEYIGKTVRYYIYDSDIYVYSSTKLISVHEVSERKLNYAEGHYVEIYKKKYIGMSSEEVESMAKKNLKKIGGIYENGNDE